MIGRKLKFCISILVLCVLIIHQSVFAQSTFYAANEEQIAELTLADLGFDGSIRLYGPYQESSVSFTLPPDWEISAPVRLDMHIYSEFQSLLEVFTSSEDNTSLSSSIEGYLTISVNGQTISTATLNENIETIIPVEIPAQTFNDNIEGNTLTMSWDTATACQYSVTSSLAVDPDSSISFPYEYKQTAADLIAFPYPFFSQNAIRSYPVALVIPDDPDEDDLSALMAVSAGLGSQSDGGLDYDIFSMNEISAEQFSDHHLILIGKTDTLRSFFNEKMNGADFNSVLNTGQNGNGILSMQVSPWNAGRAVLLITGDDGEALAKASAVIASNDFLPSIDDTTAIISEINDPISQSKLQVDIELEELTQEELLVNSLGETTITIPFNIPADTEISPEAFIELYFRHSQLLNYLQSNLTVSLNGKMVGNVRFSDASAQDGLSRVIFPPDSIQPLMNTLEFTFNITTQDVCADERSGDYWISIFKESYLHLPPSLDITEEKAPVILSNLPGILFSDRTLSSLVFTAERTDQQSWKFASKIAFSLGTFTNSSILQPSALFTESLQSDSFSGPAILIGKTSSLPFAADLNSMLPLSLETNGAIKAIPLDGIQFQLQEEQSFGLVEITRHPDTLAAFLFIMGNDETGLQSAFQVLQNRLFKNDGVYANVEIIDGEMNPHTYYLEQPSSKDEEEQMQENWLQKILNIQIENTNIYLLIGMTIITICFALWFIADSTKAKKKSKKE